MSGPLTFLSPLSALAAAAFVPPLVLLYFLKLRRRVTPVSTTLLWKRAVEDLQVNAPFQRLRNNLLLILQLLVLLLVVLAATEPMWKRIKAREKRLIVLIDHSASMSTREADGRTRLDQAKAYARDVADGLGPDDQMMVIAFADRARAIASFTGDKQLLRDRIDSIGPTEASTRLHDALTLAEAYSTPFGENIGGQTNPVPTAHLILVSDGRIPDSADQVVRRGTIEYARVGETTDNVGVVSMDVRRNYEQPTRVSVVARVRNFGSTPVQRDVSLFVDDQLRAVQGPATPLAPAPASPPAAPPSPADAPAPGASPSPSAVANGAEQIAASEFVASFEETIESAARIEVRLSGSDALTADDRAYATVDAPRPVSALLVTDGNYFLRTALACVCVTPPAQMTPQQYEDAPDADLLVDGRLKYDLVVFDGHDADRLPPGNYLFFGGVPHLDDVKVAGDIRQEVLVDWNDTHPVLRHVAVDLLYLVESNKLEMPSTATTLIEGVQGPVLSLLSRDRRQYLICSFSLFDRKREHLNTNWVLTESFPVFMYNAVQFLAGGPTARGGHSIMPGEAVEIAAPPGTRTITVRRPDGTRDTAPVGNSGLSYYGNTYRAGFYTPVGAATEQSTFAVNLFDDRESDIRPASELRMGTEEVATTSGTQRVNQPLWNLVLLAALGVLLVEWIVYNRRVFV